MASTAHTSESMVVEERSGGSEEKHTGDSKQSSNSNFYERLGSPKYVVAPMVDQSELPFRMMCRKYGAQLCYTPMLHARIFAENPQYRQNFFTTCPQDRPLFVQFCANDPPTLLKAAKFVEDQCDAVDINFGCPQGIARKGHYGSFLLSDTKLVCSLIRILAENLKIPVTCKIRILPSEEDTMKLVHAIEDAGCKLLTVHGRTKEMNKHLVGKNNFDIIKRIKSELKIPVLANGGIASLTDVEWALKYTGVDGIMTSEAILGDPLLFSGQHKSELEVAAEYMEFVAKYPGGEDNVRAHLFKFLHRTLSYHTQMRERLARCPPNDIPKLLTDLKALEEETLRTTGKTRDELYAATPIWYWRHLTHKPNAPPSKKKQAGLVVVSGKPESKGEENGTEDKMEEEKTDVQPPTDGAKDASCTTCSSMDH